MLRYIELEPPQDGTFRQAKILSVEVSEGDTINAGDTLLLLQIGGKKDKVKTPMPSTHTGKVTELMVHAGDTIHPRSVIVLLETEVDDPTPANKTAAQEPATKKQPAKTSAATTQPAQASIPGLDDVTPADTVASAAATKREATASPKMRFEFSSDDDEIQAQTTNSNKNITTENNRNKTMSEIKVPDLGGASEVEVIDILVNVGDTVEADSPLLTVESDKASMDIPASSAGTVESIAIKVGDTVSEGDVIIKLSGSASAPVETAAPAASVESPAPAPAQAAAASEVNVTIPDLGGAADVEVIDLLVAVGDTVEADQSIITVESDKASMDVPTSVSGVVSALKIAVGDTVNEGDLVLTVTSSAAAPSTPAAAPSTTPAAPAPAASVPSTPALTAPAPAASTAVAQQGATSTSGDSHASPSIRRFARELGVDLGKVKGTQRKSRISKDDVKSFVKAVMQSGNTGSAAAASGGAGIPQVPAQDFSKFGDIEVLPLNKIKRVTAAHLHRSWLNVPHVTHFDESNVASLEEFRKTLNAEYAKQKKDIKLSPLAFIVKAVVNALKAYPQFNSSLENGGENLILKNYYNIGIAVETPNGLVVPVIRDADKLSLADIAKEMGNLAKKARDGKLTANDMSGGTFTISSLGGIGGTNFTPIVNAPEVAILGVARTKTQPVWNGSEFTPAPILPISLSYDHRVIDGAEAARFTRHIASVLEDLRRLAL